MNKNYNQSVNPMINCDFTLTLKQNSNFYFTTYSHRPCQVTLLYSFQDELKDESNITEDLLT